MQLLCQLWTLNESLQEYKKAMDDEEQQNEVAAILEAHLEEDPNEAVEVEEEDETDEGWHEDDNDDQSKARYPYGFSAGSPNEADDHFSNDDQDPVNEDEEEEEEEEDDYSVPLQAGRNLPPPPGKGRIVIGPNANMTEAIRRRLPAQPPRPMYVNQPPRALPANTQVYGNILPQAGGMSYISASNRSASSSPASAMLANLANKRMLNISKR
jgi:hypothetical protein